MIIRLLSPGIQNPRMAPFVAVFNSHLRAKTLFPVIAEADAEQKRVGHVEGLPLRLLTILDLSRAPSTAESSGECFAYACCLWSSCPHLVIPLLGWESQESWSSRCCCSWKLDQLNEKGSNTKKKSLFLGYGS